MRIAKDEGRVEEVQPRFSALNILFLGIVIAGIGFLGFAYQQIYRQHTNSAFTRAIVNTIPLPAGTVNGDTFWYDELFALDTLAEVDEIDDDHLSAALHVIARRMIMRTFADELDVGRSEAEAEDEQWLRYGWTQEQYEEYVLEPLLLAADVSEAIQSVDAYQDSLRDELTHVIELYESGISFDDLAVQYSESSSSILGGDEGYHCTDLIDMGGASDDWLNEVGMISDIMTLDDQLYIATTYDSIESEDESMCDQVGLQVIAMYKNDLTDLVEAQLEDADIVLYGE